MSLTYTWKLKSLKKTSTGNYQDLIVGTQWECTGTDSANNSGTFSGATPFKAEDVNNDGFVTYEELTEEAVLSWVKAIVVGGYKQHIDEQIQKQIDLSLIHI
jgi:hypothetical protein